MLKGNELEILRILWKEGPLKPGDIQERLSEPVRNSALRAQLASLVERGQLKRRREGKAYYYWAVAAKESTFRTLTRWIADVFFEGSSVALVGQLIESAEDWTEEDLAMLRRLAETKAPTTTMGGGKKKRVKGGQKGGGKC